MFVSKLDSGLTYSLSLAFSNEDLQRIYASGSNVVIAKPAGGSTPNVAWLVVRPLPSNTITWQEQYGIYMSNTEIINGATLVQSASTSSNASPDTMYTMEPSGTISGPVTSGGTQGAFSIQNEYNNLPKGYLTTGLFQSANVDGTLATGNAVSAATCLYNSTAVMTPYTTVYLWIASSVVSNTVVTHITSPMTQVTFGGSVTSVSLVYDATSGTFLPASGQSISLGHGIQHIEPRLR